MMRAIVADPEDNQVRLELSDVFEDDDQPARAEFIRIQLALARPSVPDDERACLEQRQRELLHIHENVWKKIARIHKVKTELRQGIEERAILSGPEFVMCGEELLRFIYAGSAVVALRLWPLYRHPEEDVLTAIFGRPPHSPSQTPEEIRAAFRDCPFMNKIIELGLEGQTLDPDFQTMLGTHPTLKRLHVIDCSNCSLRNVEFLTAMTLSQLHTLLLHDNDIGATGIRQLLRNPHLEKLRRLSLANNKVTRTAASMLMSSLPALSELDLRGNLSARDQQAVLQAAPPAVRVLV